VLAEIQIFRGIYVGIVFFTYLRVNSLRRAFVEELIATQITEKIHAFVEFEGCLRYSQEFAVNRTESVAIILYHHTCFFKVRFNIIFPFTLSPPKQ
jgi:hypothetical protein